LVVTLNPNRNHRQDGFTLIELLAVVFVVGLISTLIVLNIDRGGDKVAFLEAKKFQALVVHLQDESILQGYQMGVTFDFTDNSYGFYRRKDDWMLITDDHLLRRRNVPQGVKIHVLDDDVFADENISEDDDENKILPLITLEPQGLTSNFRILFSGESASWLVENSESQEIAVLEYDGKN